MKILRKFLPFLSLNDVPDAADGSRVALTDSDQTVDGRKKLYGPTRVKQDPGKGAKNLICKADVDDLLNKLPGAAIETMELNSESVLAKGFALSKGAAEGYELTAKAKCEGSDWLYAGVDFDLADKALSWSGYPHTLAKLQVGDKMIVRYIAKGGA